MINKEIKIKNDTWIIMINLKMIIRMDGEVQWYLSDYG